MSNQPNIEMPKAEVHYFDKEENETTRFASIVAHPVWKTILRSPGNEHNGKSLNEVIEHYLQQGFKHDTL